MASAISADPNERAQLSVWRTIGSTLAGLVIGVGTPLVAYVTVNGNTVLSGSRMTIIAGVFSVCAIICYLLCFNLVRERVEVPANTEKLNIGKMLKSIGTNRALIGIIVAAILLLLAMLGMQGMSAYVFPNYYGNAAAQSLSALVWQRPFPRRWATKPCPPCPVWLPQSFMWSAGLFARRAPMSMWRSTPWPTSALASSTP